MGLGFLILNPGVLGLGLGFTKHNPELTIYI